MLELGLDLVLLVVELSYHVIYVLNEVILVLELLLEVSDKAALIILVQVNVWLIRRLLRLQLIYLR